MKKRIAVIIILLLVCLFTGCVSKGQLAVAEDNAYKKGYITGYDEGYAAGREAGYSEGEKKSGSGTNRYAQFSGSFTATVEQLIPDYFALPGNTIAVVHFFQDTPFLLHFQEDMTGKLEEDTPYVFEFETFEAEIPWGEEYPSISDYMYSVIVTGYRPADEEEETGLASITPTCEIIIK